MNRTLFALSAGIVLLWLVYLRPPVASFVGPVTVPEGTTVRQTGEILSNEGAIVSPEAFALFATLFGGARYGSYVFTRPVSAIEVAWRVARGETGAPLVKVTIPEGASSREIAALLSKALPGFDRERFIAVAVPHEGYLFPETYFFAPVASARTIVDAMRATFDDQAVSLADDLALSGRSLTDVVIMASLLEKEARLPETKSVIAGILWKRLDAGMLLQVDAVFGYIFGTTTFSPSFEDLEVDSPYNTYKNLGLPPGAIANPGLESLRAAVNPVETPYLYYLTGIDGTMHYGRTFDEHVANRRFLK